MTTTSDSPAFIVLSAQFRDTMPRGTFSDIQSLDIHTDYMLPIAAGQEAISRLISMHTPEPVILQQAADMGGRIEPVLTQQFHLEHLVPWRPVSSIVNEVSAWQNNPQRALNGEALMMAYGEIRRAVESHAENFSLLADDQKAVILDVANVGAMAEKLARLSMQGVTNRNRFKDAIGGLPVPSQLPAWGEFRAESLS